VLNWERGFVLVLLTTGLQFAHGESTSRQQLEATENKANFMTEELEGCRQRHVRDTANVQGCTEK
jgi:hypothetical protein